MKTWLLKSLFVGVVFIRIVNATIADSSDRSKNVHDYQTINAYRNYSIAGSVIHFSTIPILLGGAVWSAQNNDPKYMPLVTSIAGVTYTIGPLLSCFSEKILFDRYGSDGMTIGKSGFHYLGDSWILLGASAACFGLAALTSNNEVVPKIFVGGGICTMVGAFAAVSRSCIRAVKDITILREHQIDKLRVSFVPFYLNKNIGMVITCQY